MMNRMLTLALAALCMNCGAQNSSTLQDVGSGLDPAKRTLEVMLAFKNNEQLNIQLHLLSKAAGLNEDRSLSLYGAIDLEGEYIEFLATPGLKYGDVVTEGAVLKLATISYPGDQLYYKTPDSLPRSCAGWAFEQSFKGDSLIAVSGHLQDSPATDAKELLYLCKNMTVKQPYTEDWRKLDCDLNIVNGKLQLAYRKTAQNPSGVIYNFEVPTVL